MQCKICKSVDILLLKNFRPYTDRDWEFPIYECKRCHIKFAIRNPSIPYHEALHSSLNSPYLFHYEKAKKIKLMMSDPEQCQKYLADELPILDKLFRYLKLQKKEISILEIGCSTGYVTACLRELGYTDTLGIDISTSAIDFATKEFGPYFGLHEEKDKKYDVIFHSGLIGCVDSPIEFLNHYIDLLTDEGVMFFNAPNVASVKEMGRLWVSTKPPDLIYLFTETTFTEYLDHETLDIEVQKTLSPLKILRKIFSQTYDDTQPVSFIKVPGKKPKPYLFKQIVKKIISILIAFLVKIHIVKHYSDEYGLLVKIKKKSKDA